MARRRSKGGGLAIVLAALLLFGMGGSSEEAPRVEPDPDPLPEPKPKPQPRPGLKKAADPSLIDLDKARIEAQGVANDLKRGKSAYSKQRLKDWQGWAGLVADGQYGGRTHGALVFFGATGMPKPWATPLTSQPYTPPSGAQTADALKGAIDRQRAGIDSLKADQAAVAAELARRSAQQQKLPSQKEATSPAGTVTRPPPPLPQAPSDPDKSWKQDEMFPRGDDEMRNADELGTTILVNSTTQVSPLLQPSPTGPQIPAGYNPQKARSGAAGISAHLAKKGRAAYSRDQLKTWQRHAGLTPDGQYGGSSRGALVFFGVKDPPRPFFAPVATIPYVPPERRA